ncbi:MAG: ABC transporter permease subunit, partial [Acidobacteriota bacterium]
RLCELTSSLPWLYLLLGIRAFLPLETPPEKTLFYLAGLIGLLAWPKPARLVRGVAAAARQADFVAAARGFGAPHHHLIRRHLLPQVAGTALTQLTILVPACVLAEVVLSFFGLGVAEPRASLGSLLAAAQDLSAISLRPWQLVPVPALAALVLSYHQVSQALQSRDVGRS